MVGRRRQPRLARTKTSAGKVPARSVPDHVPGPGRQGSGHCGSRPSSSPPRDTQASRPLKTEVRAQVRRALRRNRGASMVTASREALRTAWTNRPKLWPRVAFSRWNGLPWKPTPRARRAMPMVCHSSAISPTSLIAASEPRTKRCGSFAFCAKASARSVGSVQVIRRIAGNAIAKPRSIKPSPSSREPSLMDQSPTSSKIAPLSAATIAVLQPPITAAMIRGQARCHKSLRVRPAKGKSASSARSAVEAETQSMDRASTREIRKTDANLAKGLALVSRAWLPRRFRASLMLHPLPGAHFSLWDRAEPQFRSAEHSTEFLVVGHRDHCGAGVQQL